MPAASLPHSQGWGGAEQTGSQILRDLASSSNPTLLAPPHSPSLDESTLLPNSQALPFLLSTPRARNVKPSASSLLQTVKVEGRGPMRFPQR